MTEPKPGSTEEMRKWLDLFPKKNGGFLGAALGLKGRCARIVSLLTSIAIILGGVGAFIQGVDSGRNFACKAHWVSAWCEKTNDQH
jgi:hypothetical protein